MCGALLTPSHWPAPPALCRAVPRCAVRLRRWHGVGWHQSAACKADPSCHMQTPRMDALVAEGVELDQHYTYAVILHDERARVCARLCARARVHVRVRVRVCACVCACA